MFAARRYSFVILFLSCLWTLPASAQDFLLTAESSTVSYDVASGVAAFSVILSLDEDVAAGADASLVQGFSFGLAHDGAIMTALSAAPSPALASLNGGIGPFFFFANLTPPDGAGLTVGTVFDSLNIELLTFADPSPIVTVDYESIPSALADNEVGLSSSLLWTSTLGTPDVVSVVVVDGFSLDPALQNGVLTFAPITGLFRRGDASGDANVNALVDALFLLAWQFSLGPEPPCRDAADVDNNGLVNALVDALFLLAWQFSSGPTPPAPGPSTCGSDPDVDTLDCLVAPACN